MKTREMLAKSQQADFLAPYLVRFEEKVGFDMAVLVR